MNKFQNKYRIPSARLQSWDYGANGAYFITICTAHRQHFFGKIINGEMQLNEIGLLAQNFWFEIPNHFPFTESGNFVVMPNHIHGVLIIDKNRNGSTGVVAATGVVVETPNLGVSTENQRICPNPNPNPNDTPTANTNARTAAASEKWKPQTISVVLNQYKRICTIHARKIYAGFGWQSSFYDHVILNSAEFEHIQNYIANNPKNWDSDKFKNDKV